MPAHTDTPRPTYRRPGWYPDATEGDVERYWNGKAWTDRTRARNEHGTLIAWGFITALLMPIIGAVIAIVLLARDQIGPGLAVLVASGFGFVIALALLG